MAQYYDSTERAMQNEWHRRKALGWSDIGPDPRLKRVPRGVGYSGGSNLKLPKYIQPRKK